MKLKRAENSFQNTNSDTAVNTRAAHSTAAKTSTTAARARGARRAGHSQIRRVKGRTNHSAVARS